MNTIQVIGNLGKDPRFVESKNGGGDIMFFTLADNNFTRGEKRTQWWDVAVLNPRIVASFRDSLKKGSSVVITGTADIYDEIAANGNTYHRLSLVADSVRYNESRPTSGGTDNTTYAAPSDNTEAGADAGPSIPPLSGVLPPPPAAPSEDDLPF